MKKKKLSYLKTKGEVYLCTGCGKKEKIPGDVIDYFDLTNPRTPLTGPHVFSCEKCKAEMYPEFWIEQQKRVTE